PQLEANGRPRCRPSAQRRAAARGSARLRPPAPTDSRVYRCVLDRIPYAGLLGGLARWMHDGAICALDQRVPGIATPHGVLPEGHMLVSNQEDQTPEWPNVWEEPDALGDIAFVAGMLGLFAGLMAVVRLSGSRFPDALF